MRRFCLATMKRYSWCNPISSTKYTISERASWTVDTSFWIDSKIRAARRRLASVLFLPFCSKISEEALVTSKNRHLSGTTWRDPRSEGPTFSRASTSRKWLRASLWTLIGLRVTTTEDWMTCSDSSRISQILLTKLSNTSKLSMKNTKKWCYLRLQMPFKPTNHHCSGSNLPVKSLKTVCLR